MPAKSRIFSELLAEEAANGQVHTLILIRTPELIIISTTVVGAKRRKIGLNSKFDRMVEAMNVTYQSPNQRQRTRSSSVSSYGVPQTPVDAYNGLQVGALGQDFSVIKMRNGSRSDLEAENEDTSQVSQNSRCVASLPGWLSETFTALANKHPLRLLLPSSMRRANADAVTPHDVSATNDSEDVFAFGPLPVPVGSPHVLQSPIAFHARHKSTEIPIPARLASPLSHLEPFSTAGPASSICQPSPPNSFMSSAPFLQAQLGTANGHQLSRNYEYISPVTNDPLNEQVNILTSSFAPAPSLLASPQQYSSSDVIAGTYAEHDFNTHMPLRTSSPISTPPTFSLPPCSQNDYSNYDDDNPDGVLGDDIDHRSDLSNAFATPGPTYISSRPVYFDTPTDDPSSDPPDLEYEIDYATLNFQWTPFDRKDAGISEIKHPIQSISPIIQDQELRVGTGSLPPSSDQISGDDFNLSYAVLHSGNMGSDRELPLATSSDPPVANDESANANRNAAARVEKTFVTGSHPANPPSPSPFRFTPPSRTPSPTNIVAPTDVHFQRRRVSSSRISNDIRVANKQSPVSSVSSDCFFAPPPSSGYAAGDKVEDLNVLK
ncbi:hypothetical protein J3R30DRAFT_1785617 [Lentinula aciculospora]|uniref:Uncharacterized protein n=1 Tax=Lentinula aciculospora TaxID=153920 RepID=A0A9W9AIG2_9AGAR|nr:hypothetical protein J3R30DRAFT_1785617 [Lentinula aciculospora]